MNTAKGQAPIYVWLIALYPILFLYSRNVGDVYGSQVWQAIGASTMGAALIFGVAWAITRNVAKAGAIAAILALSFFTYGNAYNLLIGEQAQFEPMLIAGYALAIAAGIV